MQINQVNIGYQAAEDRLLMRINTHDAAEFRLWLTRAVVIRMLTGLTQSENQLVVHESKTTENPLLRRAIEEFDRETGMAESDATTPFVTTVTSYPLGQQPLLVVRLDITPKTNHVSFGFTLASNQLITINLTSAMVTSISNLLHKVLKKVDWNLPYLTMQRPIISLPPSETVH
jgi:hypothetical protein